MQDLTLFERTNETIFEIWNTAAGDDSLPAIPSFYTGSYWSTQPAENLFDGTNDYDSMRDPLSLTIEGSNLYKSELTFGSSWTLIYEGSSGLISDPGRSSFGAIQILPNNSMRFASYRFLVTSKRGSENCASYSEVRFLLS
ncbi:unnamed protein product [Adineta steineri]|uniref:Uncharacterized protein n=1 Tax=Adineta steineri TaxID=433720 RepID=A0A815GGB6_9BILA|nr:unnamed protein product [Adineta steineri]